MKSMKEFFNFYQTDLRPELEKLEEILHVISVAEMPVLAEEVIADAQPKFMAKVRELRAVPPGEVGCEQAKAYYWDMAKCNPDAVAPAEVYRHVRNCASCRENVIQLRRELKVAIPEVSSAEFNNLLADKGHRQLEAVGARAWPRWIKQVGLFLVGPISRDSRAGWAKSLGSFLQTNWRTLTLSTVAAAVIVSVLIILPGRAVAVSFEEVCKAFAKVPYVYMVSQHRSVDFADPSVPRTKYWYIKEPLTQFLITKDGAYSRFTTADGKYVSYGPDGELRHSGQFTGEDLQRRVELLEEALDFRRNLGLGLRVKADWTLVEKDVFVNDKLTNLYEFSYMSSDHRKLGIQFYKKFLVNIDKFTHLPVQEVMYRRDTDDKGYDSGWELWAASQFFYPDHIPEEVLHPEFIKDQRD